MVTGYSECIDSFFAFGLFALAKRSRFFPPELVDTFEPIMQEEARHILFFVNWAAWHWRNLAWWRRPWFWCKVLAVWAFLVGERIGLARDAATRARPPQDNNFTLTGSKAVADIDLAPAALIDLCLAENERRMAGYDRAPAAAASGAAVGAAAAALYAAPARGPSRRFGVSILGFAEQPKRR